MSRRATSCRGGFSLVEVMVVIVILGVLAALVVPRVMTMGGRRAEVAALALGDLLSVAARREALTSQPVSVGYDSERNRVTLLALVTESSEAGARAAWREDRLAPPVQLGESVVASVEADGASMNTKNWRIEFSPGVRRPALGITVTDAKGVDRWRVELPAIADQAIVSRGEGKGMLGESIDLDAGGAGSTAW